MILKSSWRNTTLRLFDSTAAYHLKSRYNRNLTWGGLDNHGKSRGATPTHNHTDRKFVILSFSPAINTPLTHDETYEWIESTDNVCHQASLTLTVGLGYKQLTKWSYSSTVGHRRLVNSKLEYTWMLMLFSWQWIQAVSNIKLLRGVSYVVIWPPTLKCYSLGHFRTVHLPGIPSPFLCLIPVWNYLFLS